MKKLLFLIPLLFIISCNSVQNPEITLPIGQDIINITEEHIDEGCYLKSGLTNQEMLVVSSNVNSEELGQYEIVYQIVYKEITYTAKRIVMIVDRVPPTAALLEGIDTIKANNVHVDAGITTTDNYDTELSIEVISNVDVTTPGTYSIIYIVTDDFNNKIQLTRFVTVTE